MGLNRLHSLEAALEQTAEFAPARWQLGYVQWDNKWVPFDAVPDLAEAKTALAAYRLARERQPATVEAQLQLANWCARRKLMAQERAHLTKVLELDPDHAEARQRLGFESIDGIWYSPQDVYEAQARSAALAQSLAQWSVALEHIRVGLLRPEGARRENAKARLLEITDPRAIPAMETVLADGGDEVSLALIEAWGKMSDPEAAAAIARRAVLSESDSVRMAAALQLKSRPEEYYVPLLLSGLYTPVQSRAELFVDHEGRLVYSQKFERESQDRKLRTVVATTYTDDGLTSDAPELTKEDLEQKTRDREAEVARQNAETERINGRIYQVLARATGHNAGQRAESWWSWWNEFNEVFVALDKPIQMSFTSEDVQIETPVSSVDAAMDCLAPGTMVWTDLGPIAIHEVQVGDLVLSQDIETGELAYKPVLRLTMRPSSALLQLETDGETLRSSGGHPFWISGEGWVKARNVKPGSSLHGVAGPVRVLAADRVGMQVTYNLIVADFHTYFVGQAKVLSHDNSTRRLTAVKVPGLTDDPRAAADHVKASARKR
jgi:pretoxin HINT domain-containing protein